MEQTVAISDAKQKRKITPTLLWKKWLIVIFIIMVYHLIRDIFQDILDIHGVFTNFMHFDQTNEQLPSSFRWLNFGGYSKWVTFPLEIFLLLTIPKVWKEKTVSWLDWAIFVVLSFFELLWFLRIYFTYYPV